MNNNSNSNGALRPVIRRKADQTPDVNVVHVIIYSVFPAKVEVLRSCSTRKEAEQEILKIYEESYKSDPDVSYDVGEGRIDYDDGQNGYHSWMIAEQIVEGEEVACRNNQGKTP